VLEVVTINSRSIERLGKWYGFRAVLAYQLSLDILRTVGEKLKVI